MARTAMLRPLLALVLIGLMAALSLLAIGPGLMPAATSQRTAGASGIPLTVATAHPQHAEHGTASHLADCALARAYAAVGAAAAGDPKRMLALDPLARQRLDDARILLQESAVYAGRSATPAQVLATLQPNRPDSAHATSTQTAHTDAAFTGSSGRENSAGGAASQPTAGPLTLDLSHAIDASRALKDTPQGPLLQMPGLWAKATYDPSQQQQLVITDACAGGYAIAIYASDYSTIRLDGGLVVPGRYYEVDGHSVITGDTGCSVDIRPLSVVPVYSRGSARLPQSNG